MHQTLQHIQLASGGRVNGAGGAVDVLVVDVGATGDEQRRQIGIAVDAGEPEGVMVVIVDVVGVGTQAEQFLHQGSFAFQRGQHEGDMLVSSACFKSSRRA